ncbi:unnamed protein product, partial [Plutella xylostella]
SLFKHVHEVLFEALEVLQSVGVGRGLEVVVVVPGDEGVQRVGDQVGGVAGLDGQLPGELGDLSETVGQTLHVVTGQELLVEVVESLATTLGEGAGGLVVLHPEGEDGVEVVVEGVQTDVLGEVGDLLLLVVEVGPAGVVSQHGVNVVFVGDSVFLSDLGLDEALLHLGAADLVDDVSVEEVVGVDLVGSGQDHQDGVGAGVHEHALVDPDAGPGGGLVEGLKVLGVVEHAV